MLVQSTYISSSQLYSLDTLPAVLLPEQGGKYITVEKIILRITGSTTQYNYPQDTGIAILSNDGGVFGYAPYFYLNASGSLYETIIDSPASFEQELKIQATTVPTTGDGNLQFDVYYTTTQLSEPNPIVEFNTIVKITGSADVPGQLIMRVPALFGEANAAAGTGSFAQGIGTIAIGRFSHAEGQGTNAEGDGSHAEGDASQAFGSYSHTEGLFGEAYAEYSHTEGRSNVTIISASYSHAEGEQTTTYGVASHTEGYFTEAYGSSSHAEGYYTRAIGDYSHAEGSASIAYGRASHADGLHTIASGSAQTVVGKYNKHNNTTDLFVVGGGSDNNNRKDLFAVSTNAVIVSGSLNVLDSLSATIVFTPQTSPAFNGEIVKFGAGTLTAGQLYFLSSSGTWSLANANSTGSSVGMLGIAAGASPTVDGLLVRGYAFSGSFSQSTGSILYMATSSGLFTETSPSSSGHVVRVIGYKTTVSNTIYFMPDATWVTLA